jgi:hypothetical protein
MRFSPAASVFASVVSANVRIATHRRSRPDYFEAPNPESKNLVGTSNPI